MWTLAAGAQERRRPAVVALPPVPGRPFSRGRERAGARARWMVSARPGRPCLEARALAEVASWIRGCSRRAFAHTVTYRSIASLASPISPRSPHPVEQHLGLRAAGFDVPRTVAAFRVPCSRTVRFGS